MACGAIRVTSATMSSQAGPVRRALKMPPGPMVSPMPWVRTWRAKRASPAPIIVPLGTIEFLRGVRLPPSRLAGDAAGRRRQRFEPLLADGPAAVFAHAVAAMRPNVGRVRGLLAIL